MAKLVHVRRPRLRVTSKGVKLSGGGVRIGGKVGINLSKSGVSTSVRTPLGTVNSKRGFSPKRLFRGRKRGGCLPGCLVPMALGAIGMVIGVLMVR